MRHILSTRIEKFNSFRYASNKPSYKMYNFMFAMYQTAGQGNYGHLHVSRALHKMLGHILKPKEPGFKISDIFSKGLIDE